MHRRETWISYAGRRSGTSICDTEFLVEEIAAASRILLSLGQHQHWRASLGIGDFLGRYRDSPLWRSDLPRTLQTFCHHPTCRPDFSACGMDLALGRHLAAFSRLDPRGRFSCLSLGLLQRTDDDVFAGHGIFLASSQAGSLECLEAPDF